MKSIINAKDIPLAQSQNSLPQMSVAITGWFQPMKFGKVIKEQIDGRTQERVNWVNTQGVRQPYTEEQLKILPEGERSWKWCMFHALPSLVLVTDDIVLYLGVPYRIMGKLDYKEYGYVQYNAIEDYTVCELPTTC